MKRSILNMKYFVMSSTAIALVHLPTFVMAQSITGTIKDATEKLTTILMLIMVGAAAWAGFELKSGNPQAINKLIYCIVGIIIVGSASAIVNFFKV